MIPINAFPLHREVSYSKVRATIRSGDILLCSGNSMFSRLIKRATGSIWSHVGIILRQDNIDRIFVLESVETIGVRAVALSSYVNNYNGSHKGYDGQILIARHSEFNPSMLRTFSLQAVDLLGYQYDSLEIARIVKKLAFRWAGIGKKSTLRDNGLYICSEYSDKCLKSVGIHVPHDGFIVPSDFAKDKHVDMVCVPKVIR